MPVTTNPAATVAELLGDSYLGSVKLPEIETGHPEMRIVRTYLCNKPDMPYFGKMLAVLEYRDRCYMLYFHVWRDGQKPSNANRMTDISELEADPSGKAIRLHETDFALKAFWLHTPDTGLDPDALALRAAGKALKKFSVANRLCKRFKDYARKDWFDETWL